MGPGTIMVWIFQIKRGGSPKDSAPYIAIVVGREGI